MVKTLYIMCFFFALSLAVDPCVEININADNTVANCEKNGEPTLLEQFFAIIMNAGENPSKGNDQISPEKFCDKVKELISADTSNNDLKGKLKEALKTGEKRFTITILDGNKDDKTERKGSGEDNSTNYSSISVCIRPAGGQNGRKLFKKPETFLIMVI